MVPQIVRIEALVCDSVHEAAWLERNLLDTSLPRWNRWAGGEVPTFVRLDLRPRVVGLTAAHEFEARPGPGVRFFGPYLGGDRVREAIGGLQRVLPLRSTRTALRESERDLARVQRTSEADQGWMLAATIAVLERDPAAVKLAMRGLADLRDQAAEVLAFEVAGRIQAELDALEWVTSPQRVTVLADDGDVDVDGWADGVLVHAEVRGGRLRRWSQQSLPADAGLRRAAATPDRWRAFADRNAELAAALTRAAQPNAGQGEPVSHLTSGGELAAQDRLDRDHQPLEEQPADRGRRAHG